MKDVNNTRYHLLLGEEDWAKSRPDSGLPAGLQSAEQASKPPDKQWAYDKQREGIHIQADVFTFQQIGSKAQPLVPENRRDSDVDSYGHRYWIDESGTQILVRWAEAKSTETLFPFSESACSSGSSSVFAAAVPSVPKTAESLSGLAILSSGYLVAGSPDTASLLAFDLYALDGGFLRISLPVGASGQSMRPFDLTACADGGLLVLDSENKLVLQLDSRLGMRSGVSDSSDEGGLMLFQPSQGTARREKKARSAEPIEIAMTGVPVAIAALLNGGFWLLEHESIDSASTLWYYPPGATAANEATALPLLTENLIDADDTPLGLEQIVGYDLVYVRDTLFVTDIKGNQVYGLHVNKLAPLVIRIEKRYYPLRSLAPVSLIVGQSEIYYLQAGDRWLPLKQLPRQRYQPKAVLVLPSFDGHEPGCLWHRLCIDACLPPETAIKIEVRAADEPDALEKAIWEQQPTPYKRHRVEVSYGDLWRDPWDENVKEDADTGTWELLFQQVKGQYMEIRLTLTGNLRSSPLVRSLRAHYPRFSYLQSYLPDVYQQDPTSSSFLDRFLSNPEGILTTTEGLIAQVQTHFDVRTVPSESVTWLASWIGLALEESWSDYQRRLLIAQAPYFFQRRGTYVGLLQAILLAIYPDFGPRIFQDDVAELCSTVRIVERFLTRTQSSVAVGDPTEQDAELDEGTTVTETTDDSRAHRFTVLIPTTLEETKRRLVEQIVELEKPAHTAFTIKQYWAMFRVGEVRLGIDTVLGRGGQFETFELGRSALAEAALAETFPYSITNRTVLRK